MSSQRTHISFFNSPQFFFGLLGHSGLVIEHLDKTCHLYSFHPEPNNGEPFGPGSIAQIANPADGRDIDRFIRAAMTPHADDGREDSRGIRIENTVTGWYERIRRIIRMEVTVEQADAIEAYAQRTVADPPKFNIATDSCEHFVDRALAAGGVVLRSKFMRLNRALVPNHVYRAATARTEGVTDFRKIDFQQYLEKAPQSVSFEMPIGAAVASPQIAHSESGES